MKATTIYMAALGFVATAYVLHLKTQMTRQSVDSVLQPWLYHDFDSGSAHDGSGADNDRYVLQHKNQTHYITTDIAQFMRRLSPPPIPSIAGAVVLWL